MVHKVRNREKVVRGVRRGQSSEKKHGARRELCVSAVLQGLDQLLSGSTVHIACVARQLGQDALRDEASVSLDPHIRDPDAVAGSVGRD